MSEEPRDIGVLIIGGYLGSGKTTLVNHILRSGTGRETLVLVNDFGEIAIDGDLIEADSDGVVTLVNGCSCCALSTPLIEFLVSLRERETRPQLLIIEASGVANTALVASHAMIPGFRLEGVVTVVDAETIGARLSDDYVGNTVQRQIEAALAAGFLHQVSAGENQHTADQRRAQRHRCIRLPFRSDRSDAGMEPCRPKELRSLLKTGGHPTAEFGFPFLLQELADNLLLMVHAQVMQILQNQLVRNGRCYQRKITHLGFEHRGSIPPLLRH